MSFSSRFSSYEMDSLCSKKINRTSFFNLWTMCLPKGFSIWLFYADHHWLLHCSFQVMYRYVLTWFLYRRVTVESLHKWANYDVQLRSCFPKLFIVHHKRNGLLSIRSKSKVQLGKYWGLNGDSLLRYCHMIHWVWPRLFRVAWPRFNYWWVCRRQDGWSFHRRGWSHRWLFTWVILCCWWSVCRCLVH